MNYAIIVYTFLINILMRKKIHYQMRLLNIIMNLHKLHNQKVD